MLCKQRAIHIRKGFIRCTRRYTDLANRVDWGKCVNIRSNDKVRDVVMQIVEDFLRNSTPASGTQLEACPEAARLKKQMPLTQPETSGTSRLEGTSESPIWLGPESPG